MKQIDIENLNQSIEFLKKGECIIIPVSKEICNIINLLTYQCESMENLFMSYINKTIDKANPENLNKFLEQYTNKFMEKEITIKNLLLEIVGQKAYEDIAKCSLGFYINDVTSTLQLFRR